MKILKRAVSLAAASAALSAGCEGSIADFFKGLSKADLYGR